LVLGLWCSAFRASLSRDGLVGRFPPHSDILRRLVLLIGVVGYFLVLRPLQQALPDLYFFRDKVLVRPETQTELRLQTYRFPATPLPQSLGAFKLDAQFLTSSLTVEMSLAISGGHASMTSLTFFYMAMPSVHVIGM